MTQLTDLISQAAAQCEADGVAIDGAPNGAVCQWVRRNVSYRPDQEFFVVTLITAEMADRQARKEGYTSQSDRAAQLAFRNTTPVRVSA